jgi:hypothetical protein
MHARVWQLQIRPGKVQDFKDTLSSVVDLARQQAGFHGVLALSSGKSESPDVTVVRTTLSQPVRGPRPEC